MGLNNSRPTTGIGFDKMVQDYKKLEETYSRTIETEAQKIFTKLDTVIDHLDLLCNYYINQGCRGFVLYKTIHQFNNKLENDLNKKLTERWPDRIYRISVETLRSDYKSNNKIIIYFITGLVDKFPIAPYQEQLNIAELQPVPV